MFSYPKEEQISIINIILLKIELVYDKGQDTTTINWRSN